MALISTPGSRALVSGKLVTEINLADQGMVYGGTLFRSLADHMIPPEEPL
jgi:hypothetical protein